LRKLQIFEKFMEFEGLSQTICFSFLGRRILLFFAEPGKRSGQASFSLLLGKL